jgi:hypothetical protein
MQVNMLSSFIDADTQLIDRKHTGKYISNLNFDVMQITKMLSEAFLSIFQGWPNFNWPTYSNVYPKLEIITCSNNNDTSSFCYSKNFR